MFAVTFSQRSGIEQSMMITIISAIIGHMTQQGSQAVGAVTLGEEESNQPFPI
jgi:hypothetical protein